MITRLQLENVRSHERTEVDVSPLTVIVGPNGSGKTTMLRALSTIIDLEHDHWSNVFGGAFHPALVVRGDETSFAMHCEAEGPDGSPRRMGLRATLTREGAWECEQTASVPPPPGVIAEPVARSPVLRLDAERLAEATPVAENPQFSPDGFGLATVLAERALAAQLEPIVADLRRVVPTLEGVRVVQLKGGQLGRFGLRFDFVGRRDLPSAAVSEGTHVLLALLTMMHAQPGRPRLVLLDDLEKALHPRAQRELIGLFRRFQQLEPGLQIIATSHSPYLVDELQPSEVLVCALDAQGRTRCRSLADHPDAARATGVLTTGEFLSAEGEEWVLGA